MPPVKNEGESDADGDMSGAESDHSASSRAPDHDSSAEEADEPDSDDSSEMSESECERRRSDCLDNLTNLEKQFIILKEQLYKEKMNQVDQQLLEIRGGRSQEYLAPLQRLVDNMNSRKEVAEILKNFRIENIRHKFESELQASRQHFEDLHVLLLLVLGTRLLLLPVHTLVYLTATAYLFIIPIVFDETRHPRTRKVFSADWIQCIPSLHSNPSQLPSLSVVTTSSSLTIKYKACHWTGTASGDVIITSSPTKASSRVGIMAEKKMKSKELKRKNTMDSIQRIEDFLVNFDAERDKHEITIRLSRLDKLMEAFESIQGEYEAFDDSPAFVAANAKSEKQLAMDAIREELMEKIRRLEEDRHNVDISWADWGTSMRTSKVRGPGRKKAVTVSGPYIVYMLREEDILEDWTSIRKALKRSTAAAT